MNRLKTWKPRIVTINPILTIVFVSLCPLVAVSENHNHFTFGSTVSEVVAAHREPDAIDERAVQLSDDSEREVLGFTYKYGKSKVDFDRKDGSVMGWLSHRDNPLRTPFQKDHLLLPIDWNKEYITLGSTEDEVIAVQGKPDYISRARYRALGECHSYIYGDYYGENGNIEFENGRVTGWDIRTSPLKVKLVPEENTVEKDYFTLGYTLDEVAAIQGTPDYFTFPYFLLYGSSKVSLKDGRVASWQNTTANPLKVRLLPKQKTINKGYFTLESTRDEVLAVQGTPDWFYGLDSESKFFYGSSDTLTEMSQVCFEEDLVVGWISASTPLKTGPFSGDCFTIGSTKEEVLSIQGTPDDHGDTFRYGTAGVEFQNGRVTGWWHIGGSRRLKVKLLPKQNPYVRKYFTIGSTKDEVLALLGTPEDCNTNYQATPDGARFGYDGFDVYFRNDRVTEWVQSRFSTLEASFEKNRVNASGSKNPVQFTITPFRGSYFTIGSTIKEVLAIQGTPDERVVPTLIHDDKFRYDYDLRFVYGSSYVGFIDGRVAGWKSASNRRLNVELHPGQISGDRSHFTVESTIDEVLTVQGPPDAYIGAGKFATKYATNSSVFNLLEFEFGHSKVTFNRGHVSNWESSSKSPLKVKYPLTGKLTIP